MSSCCNPLTLQPYLSSTTVVAREWGGCSRIETEPGAGVGAFGRWSRWGHLRGGGRRRAGGGRRRASEARGLGKTRRFGGRWRAGRFGGQGASKARRHGKSECCFSRLRLAIFRCSGVPCSTNRLLHTRSFQLHRFSIHRSCSLNASPHLPMSLLF